MAAEGEELKHTPGPWKFEGYTPRPLMREHSVRIYAEDPGPENDFHIGYVVDVDQPTREANARLIAAAPDGYALAEEIANHLFTKQDIDRVREMAKEFLRKVRG